MSEVERIETIVIGGGQAGLSVGYHLARRGLPFVILEANERIGDSWRQRWDSLRLFSPARFDGLAGMPFPAPAHSFPTKDEMADYLESYAAKFKLPVRTGVKVERLSRRGDMFVAAAGDRWFEAKYVVVAMADFQRNWADPVSHHRICRAVAVDAAAVSHRLPSTPHDQDAHGPKGAPEGAEQGRSAHPRQTGRLGGSGCPSSRASCGRAQRPTAPRG